MSTTTTTTTYVKSPEGVAVSVTFATDDRGEECVRIGRADGGELNGEQPGLYYLPPKDPKVAPIADFISASDRSTS